MSWAERVLAKFMQQLSCDEVRHYMRIWIKEELMPAIEHECMEWLDNDVMPQVHWEAMKMGFQADVMYKPTSDPPKEPCPPSGPPPAHLMRAAKRGHESGSGMGSGSGTVPLPQLGGMSSGSCVTQESDMENKKSRYVPPLRRQHRRSSCQSP